MADAAIDRATFEELKATAGSDFVGELIETFLAEAPMPVSLPRSRNV